MIPSGWATSPTRPHYGGTPQYREHSRRVVRTCMPDIIVPLCVIMLFFPVGLPHGWQSLQAADTCADCTAHISGGSCFYQPAQNQRRKLQSNQIPLGILYMCYEFVFIP